MEIWLALFGQAFDIAQQSFHVGSPDTLSEEPVERIVYCFVGTQVIGVCDLSMIFCDALGMPFSDKFGKSSTPTLELINLDSPKFIFNAIEYGISEYETTWENKRSAKVNFLALSYFSPENII